MKSEEFDFKEFILDNTNIDPITNQIITKKPKAKPEYEYNIEWKDGNDFIISKKTTKSKNKTFLVCMVSQEQFYIKNSKGDIFNLQDLDESVKRLNMFLKDIETPIELNINWLRTITSERISTKNIYTGNKINFANKAFIALIKENGYHTDTLYKFLLEKQWSEYEIPYGSKNLVKRIRLLRKMYTECTDLSDLEIRKLITKTVTHSRYSTNDLKETPAEYMTFDTFAHTLSYNWWTNLKRYINKKTENNEPINKNLINFLQYVYDEYTTIEDFSYRMDSIRYNNPLTYLEFICFMVGEDKCMDMIKTIIKEANNHFFIPPSLHYVPYIFDFFEFIDKFTTPKFTEYISTQQYKQNYLTFKDFLSEWADTIQMQITTDGKVTESYPDDLNEIHNIYAIKERIKHIMQENNKRIQNDETISKLKEKYSFILNHEDDKYIFRLPESTKDILDEAAMQHNCLASYINAYIEEKCILIFMRYKREPENSLVTIELEPDTLKAIQIKQKYNHDPTPEQLTAITEWVTEFQKNTNILQNAS